MSKRRFLPAKAVCYNPKPVVAMDDKEAAAFSLRQALRAAQTLDMDDKEKRLYANAVLASIRYFNARSSEHGDIMRYRAECDAQS